MGIFDRIRKAVQGDGDEGGHDEHEQEEGDAHSHSHAHGNESLAETYAAALDAQRHEKDHFFLRDPYSPIPYEERDVFEGLKYYPANLDLQFVAPLDRTEPEPLTFQTSTGDQQRYERIGTVRFEVEGQPAELAIYQSEDDEALFVPFRDSTSGKETYGAGRYLEPIPLDSDNLLVDFNLAYNPYCAYSPDYSCPLPPIENWLKVPIRAGEMNYKDESY